MRTTNRWTRATIVAAVLVASAASGCDGGETTTGAGGGGTGGGGGAPGCEVGSHDDGTGTCVATLGEFAATSPIANARDHHVTWAAKRPSGTYLYVAGGALDLMSAVRPIERSKIAEDGSLGVWETLDEEIAVMGPMVVATDDVVVIAGGMREGGTANVSVSKIADDGTLAFEDGPELAKSRFHGAAVLVNGRVYATGGLDGLGTSLDTIETATLDGTTLSTWSAERVLPAPVSHHGLATDGHALVVTGGLKRVGNDFANDVFYDGIYRSEIAEDGSLGEWKQIGTTPFPIAVHASFVHAGYLYLMHGLDNDTSQFRKSIERAPLAADGTLGAWETLPVRLPITRGHCHQTPIVDGFIYSVAGTNTGGSQVDAFFAKFE
jgi:hypothetical protein